MTNENLVKLYTTLTTPNQALGGKAFFTPESLGGSADVFAEKLKDRANLEKLFTTITSPSDALGGKAFFTPEALGGNANVFAEKIGFGAQKKNLIGSESTSGSEPSQGTSPAVQKASIGSDVKSAIISLEGAQMALVNKDKEIANLDKSLAGGRDVGGSFLQVDRNLEKVVEGLDKKLAKERQFIQKSVENTIVKVKPVLNKVIDEKINDATIGSFTRNVDGKIVPDETKISSYANEIIKQTGLSEGKYVKDFIYNEVKANVSNKLTQPKIEKVFNDLYKKKYGVSVEEDINKDFVDKFKDVNAVKAQAEVKLNTVKELAKTDFTNEMSVVSNEFKTRADAVNANYKQITEQINNQAESLNAQYQSGVLPQEQYSAGIAKLNSDLEANYKAYKGNFDQMADEFLKTQNAVASRYDKRLRRQYSEIDKAAKVEVENRLAKYKAQYKISPELEARYSKTYQEAADKFKKQEGVLDYQIDKSKGAATVLGESLLSGLGQGIKGLSYMADFDLGKVYGEYLENSFRLSESNLESIKDLLDPIKLARSSGQTIGAMAPMLAGNALIASATMGTSIPVQLAATGGFGFFMESMQMAGDMYDRKMQQTGIVADAEKAAAKVIQANTMLLPLYAFDGLPLINNATLGIKNRALRGLAKGGIETVTEISQEVPQSAFEDVIYRNKPLTDVIDKFDITKKENRDEIFNTVLNVVPSSFLMGSAPTFLGYANKPIAEIRGRTAFAKEQLEGLTDNAMEQFFYDMQLTKGATFTKAFLSAAYSSGQVNEMQLIKLTDIVDKSTKVLEDAKELKLSNGESKVYAAYEFAADAYTKQANAMEDGVAKDALLAKAAAIKKQAVNYLNTKEGDYVVLVLPNGEQYVYQPDFFTSSVSNYNTLKNLLAKKLATAQVVSSTKEGDKVKARIMGHVRILDSAPDDIQEFTEEEGGMSPEIQSQLDGVAIEIGELEISLEQPSLSPESKQKIEARLSELDKIAQGLLSGNKDVEYVSEGDNFFKILLDGTREPVTEAEFDKAVSTPKPINEKNGEMVTVNFGGKAITGTVEVDEGGKASIYSGGVVYELPNETEYVDYASPVRVSDVDGSIEFDGVSYPEVRIESANGTEMAVLIDENGKPKTVKDPKIVEEFKYQITLANLAEITEEEAITLLSEYEQDSKTKVDDATEGGANQADAEKRSEEDIKLQEAIDEIDLIELIALEELDNADANAKLVEYKPANSKDTKVYLVKKNADGTVSATLDGKKVRRGAVLTSLSEAYDLQSKEGSKKLATKLQEQVNALKADVESKLFGKTPKVEAPVVEKSGDFDSYNLTPTQKKLAETYKDRITKLKNSNPKQYWSVDIPSDDVIAEAAKNDMMVDVDGGMGIVTADGNMIGMFKYDQSKKGTSVSVQAERIKKGGIKLDNFDGYLTRTYQKNGFRVVARVPFNEEFAPEGWDKEAHGTPDVVMMIYDPNNQLDIEEKRFENPETGYEDAMNYRDSFVDQARENLKTQEDATKESSQQVIQGGEQGSSVQRQRADEGQQKTGERKRDERKAEKPEADNRSGSVSSRKEQEKVEPKKEAVKKEPIKKDDSKPTGLSPLETKFKETPEALSKDELKEVLDAKRERYKKAIAAIEKGDLEGDALKAKQKAVDALENTIEDLVKRIDAGVVQKIATKDQSIGSEFISVKNQPKTKKSLDGLKAEFSDNKVKMKVIEAVEKGISVLQSAFPSMNIVIHKSSSDFLEATGLPMVNGKVPSGVFMYSGDAKIGYEGTIHINLTNANQTVVYHEIAHALMLKTLGENKAMFDSFKNKVSKILSEKTAANLDAFIEPYPEFEKSEEYIVQLVAALAATKSNTNPSVLMKLKVAINELVSKITGGKIKVFAEEAEGIDVYNFLKQMAEAIKEGRDINILQESFNDNLFEPTELDITGIAPDDIPTSGRYPRAKEFRGDYEMVDHPIITNKILKGKPIAVTMSDHTKVGVYKNDKSGVEYGGLMGGVFYPYIKGVRDAGLGWASVTTKAARSLVANALNTDYTVVYRMSRATGSIGNVNFGDIAFLELTAPVTNNKVSEKRFLSELNSQLSKVKAGINFLEKYGINGKVTSIASLKKGLDKMSFSARGEFWKVVMKGSWNKKSTGSWYQFLEKYNVASLEDIVNGLAEIEVDTALDHDVVAVLKIAKPEYTNDGIIKIYTTRKELVNEKKGVFFIDAPNHPSYPYVVKGEPVGVLNEFNNISEYFPVIKKWIESKRLNSPYKAVETMGKELISSRISELESQLKTSKEFIKKYKDDLFSKSLGVAKTPEQMVQAMKEDIKFFNAIVDFAYLSIKLRGLKTIEAFKAELEKQLGVKFDKMPQELKDVWNEAKKLVVDEKKQTPTVKQTIKEATEQKTSPEKVATFAEYMAAKYKGMAEGEKIGQRNRFEIIKEAAKYVKQAVSSDVSRAKINALINKAVNIQGFDSIKSFAKYVDGLIEKQNFYAKLMELESLSSKVNAKLKNEKFGSIAPQVRRLLSVNPENLTEGGIDKYISLAKDLLSSKVADVTNLESTLAQLKAEQRTFIEGKLASNLMSDEEMIKSLDEMELLFDEISSETLEKGIEEAKSKEKEALGVKLRATLDAKKEEIMEYVSGDKRIRNAKDYVSLINAIKKYNNILDRMVDVDDITPSNRNSRAIDLSSNKLTEIEESLKEQLKEFKVSLTDQITNTLNSIKNQYDTGGIRARLFEKLTDFEKLAYDPILKKVLTIPTEILPDLKIEDLDILFKAVDQLYNGYVSPELLRAIELIEAKAYQNSIDKNAVELYDLQVDKDGKYKAKQSLFSKSVSEFKGGFQDLAEYMKTLDYTEIQSYINDGYAKIFGEYIYNGYNKGFTRYKSLLEKIIPDVLAVDDRMQPLLSVNQTLKIDPKAEIIRRVVGIFLVQADHLRHKEYENWDSEQKDLAKYLLNRYNEGKINVSKSEIDALKTAYDLVDGDLTTEEGLADAKAKFFSKNPIAKELFNAIRSSIDNKIAPLNKISIEREGGSLVLDENYFPISTIGSVEKDLKADFESMGEAKSNRNFKRRANATFQRTGDPFVMRDFNASRVFFKTAEEAARNYELKPVVTPFNQAMTELAKKYELEGRDSLAKFIKASQKYVYDSTALQFERLDSSYYNQIFSAAYKFVRRYRLANLYRIPADFLGNIAKVAASMNPAEYAKLLVYQFKNFDDEAFSKLSDVISSTIVFKTSRANVENLQFSRPERERKVDAMTGIADVAAQSATWKALMIKNFKDISGKELDFKAINENAFKYYTENKAALNKAAYLAEEKIDKLMVVQSPIGRAPTVKVIPFITNPEFLKKATFKRTDKSVVSLNFMGSYIGKDASRLAASFKEMMTTGNVSGFAATLAPIMVSQFVYTSILAYFNALASITAYAISVGLDDEEENDLQLILDYSKKEMAAVESIFNNPKEFMKAYAVSLMLLPMGKYPTLGRAAIASITGFYSGWDINRAKDKAERKQRVNYWEENYSVIKDKIYVRPIVFDKKLQSQFNYKWQEVASLAPVTGFVLNEMTKQIDPTKETSLVSMFNEFDKKDPDQMKIITAGINISQLFLLGTGSAFAPNYLKIINEKAKSDARKDFEEKKKKGGKSSQTKNPFGSSGFGSGGLKGGL